MAAPPIARRDPAGAAGTVARYRVGGAAPDAAGPLRAGLGAGGAGEVAWAETCSMVCVPLPASPGRRAL